MRCHIICILLLISHFIPLATAREWVNQKGQKVEGEFIELRGDTVALKVRGKIFKIPLSSLSEADQKFAKEAASGDEDPDQEANATPPSGPVKLGGRTLKRGEMNILAIDLSIENQKISERGGPRWRPSWSNQYAGEWLTHISKDVPLTQVNALIGLPPNFDPEKPTPIFFQFTSSDSKNNVKGAKSYWKTCKSKGWILLAVDGLPSSSATWANSTFYAGAKEIIERMHAKWPATKGSPMVVGGFSGGSKISQWMGPIISNIPDTNVKGLWIGGCNEVFFEYARQDLNVSNRTLKKLKAYISTGTKDKLVSASLRNNVASGFKDARLKEIRNEVYPDGHRISQEQLAEGMDWLIEED